MSSITIVLCQNFPIPLEACFFYTTIQHTFEEQCEMETCLLASWFTAPVECPTITWNNEYIWFSKSVPAFTNFPIWSENVISAA